MGLRLLICRLRIGMLVAARVELGCLPFSLHMNGMLAVQVLSAQPHAS